MSNTIDLATLGITKDEIIQRIVDRAAEAVLHLNPAPIIEGGDVDEGDTGDANYTGATLMVISQLETLAVAAANKRVDEIAARDVVPLVLKRIDTLVVQRTNELGETKGQPQTFTEYLVARADAWLQERVQRDSGEDRQAYNKRTGGYWNERETIPRIEFLIGRHMSRQIEMAMRDAINKLDKSLVNALQTELKRTFDAFGKTVELSLQRKD